jgi:hypothetical protein
LIGVLFPCFAIGFRPGVPFLGVLDTNAVAFMGVFNVGEGKTFLAGGSFLGVANLIGSSSML